MKIYVASSWRNAHQPKVVEVLRSAGHEVYDFKNPKPGNVGFSWRQVDAEHGHGEPVTAERWRRMVDHPIALDGYALDMGAMKWADACVYVLPCGRSASFEAGWFQGQGKPLVVLAFEPMEPELMFREAAIVGSLAGMLDAVTEAAVPTPSEPPAGSARGVPGAGAASERRAGPAKACCKQGAKLAEDWVERYKCPVHGWQDNPREAAGGAESEAEVDGAPPTASPIVAVGVPEGKPAGPGRSPRGTTPPAGGGK